MTSNIEKSGGVKEDEKISQDSEIVDFLEDHIKLIKN